MPKQSKISVTPYDLRAFRARYGLTQEETAQMLGVSASKIWRIEREGAATKEMQWACYGIACHVANQQQTGDKK